MEGTAASIVLIAIVLAVLLAVAFDLMCLVHLAGSRRVRALPKLAWAIFIICVSPLGGAVYLLSQRRPSRLASPAPR